MVKEGHTFIRCCKGPQVTSENNTGVKDYGNLKVIPPMEVGF